MKVVYKIENTITNKLYIGKTHCLKSRISLHKSRVKNLKYSNELIEDMRKYGFENFKFTIIEEFDDDFSSEELFKREKYWIKYYDTFNNGYNRNEGNGGLGKGKYTEEILEKYRRHKEKNGFYNKTHTKEFRKRINVGRQKTKEEKEKLSISSKRVGKENRLGKKCILVLEDKTEIKFNTLNSCYNYVKENNLFPNDYSFNTFTRWSRQNRLKDKGINFKIIEISKR